MALALLVWISAALADDPLVVIANPDARVEQMDAERITQIYLKQIQTWPDGKTVVPIDIKEGSPLRAEFYKRVTGRSLGQIRAYWARQVFTGMGFPPKQVATPEEMREAVQGASGAIGYIGKQDAQDQDNVKILLEAGQ